MKRVYRVRSVHKYPKFYGTQKTGTYTRTRHFFTKFNAQRSYDALKKKMEQGLSYGDWGKPVSVQISESEPLIFMDDEAHLFESE